MKDPKKEANQKEPEYYEDSSDSSGEYTIQKTLDFKHSLDDIIGDTTDCGCHCVIS